MFRKTEVPQAKKPSLFADYDDYSLIVAPIIIDENTPKLKKHGEAFHDRGLTCIDISSQYFKKFDYTKAETYMRAALNDIHRALEIFKTIPKCQTKKISCEKLTLVIAANIERILEESSPRLKKELFPPSTPERLTNPNPTNKSQNISPQIKKNSRIKRDAYDLRDRRDSTPKKIRLFDTMNEAPQKENSPVTNEALKF
ncbi:MAG: hypothetical protein P1U74_03685 [Legionellaceae bacterium]|nr:hypothetical protein [Legionellaceae bacterium]